MALLKCDLSTIIALVATSCPPSVPTTRAQVVHPVQRGGCKLGSSADDLYAMKCENEQSYNNVFKDLLFKEFITTTRSKAEPVNEETRVQSTIFRSTRSTTSRRTRRWSPCSSTRAVICSVWSSSAVVVSLNTGVPIERDCHSCPEIVKIIIKFILHYSYSILQRDPILVHQWSTAEPRVAYPCNS